MKRLIAFFITFTILFTFTGCEAQTQDSIYSINYNGISYNYNDLWLIESNITEQESKMLAAAGMADAARSLGYPEEHHVIQLAKQEWAVANNVKTDYCNIYNELKDEYERRWALKQQEYPHATYIWLYLKSYGCSDYVCAGIMGNLMAEVGGQTLNIQYWLVGDENYYGMCQWYKAYSDIWGGTLEEQCAYLINTMKYQFDTYGKNYKKDFNYEQFLQMTDVSEAAKAFAACYERCSSKTYKKRQKNAKTAYEYFVN